MDISSSGSALAVKMAQAVSAAKGASSPMSTDLGKPAGGADFIDSLDAALKAVSQSQNQATGLQREFQMENPNVSLEDTMIAMNKASISFGAAVQTRNKLVTAYEQIMNMPV
jgi:flagellar hook-basal body complex protein FliE